MFLIDFVYGLIIALKDDSPTELFDFKAKIATGTFTNLLIKSLTKENESSGLLGKIIKLIENLMDCKEFYIHFRKNKGLDCIGSLLETGLEGDIQITLYAYVVKGLRLGIFHSQRLFLSLIRQIIADFEYSRLIEGGQSSGPSL